MSRSFAEAVETGNPDAIASVLHPDVEFCSPAVFTPYRGREATMTVLRAFMSTVSGFGYVSSFTAADGEQVLRFAARVGDREIEGVDIVRTDDAGLVTHLTVMVRPIKGLGELVARMGALLAPPPDRLNT